ncbi:CaiB/BaiF CoA transferase family protein [Pseudonocardia halophobica]|uniref:CaiB/BaiF CoA transferase family protein n=1 Tax=Pseudonocardia halophobica TaxID=29401 RepID=UPI003D8BCBD3
MTGVHGVPSPDGIADFGPLQGMRILDLTAALAGAFATMLLADMGAEVIKIESVQHYPTPSRGPRNPPRGDAPGAVAASRDYPDSDPGEDPWNRLSWFNSHSRNKRNATMDITRPEGRELFLRLVEVSDGLVENNAAGLLEKLGLPPEVLLERNPQLVVVRMPPLGSTGPDANATGFGWHFEELAGFLEVQGYPDGQSVGSIFMDGSSGPAGANAFLTGLFRRRRTGSGCVVEVGQVENMIVHIGDLVMDAVLNDRVPARDGNRSPDFAPQGVYPCAGPDDWVVLSVRDERDWEALRSLVGDPALADPALEAVDERRRRHDEIDAVLARWTRTQSKFDLFHALQGVGIPAGPVMDEADATSDPQLHERGFFHLLEHRRAGWHFHPGANVQLTGTPTQIVRAAPITGQDNEYVYRSVLGVDDEEYAALVRAGHVGDTYL